MEKKDNNEMLLINILIIGVGTILTKLISFIMTPFYSSWLSTSDYGVYDLLSTYVFLCVPFATMQLDQAVYRFAMEDNNNAKAAYKTAFRLVLVASILVSFAIFIVLKVLNYNNKILVSFSLYFIAVSFYNISSEFLRGMDMMVDYSIHSIIVGVVTVVASVILVYRLRQGVAGLLFVYAFAYIISTLDILLRYRPLKTTKNRNVELKRMLYYSIPLIPNVLAWWIINVSDRTIISIFMGSLYNGIYGICCKIPTMLSLVFSIFSLSFQQIVMKSEAEASQRSYYNYLIKKVIKILFSGSITIIGITPIIYYQFLKSDYWPGIYCVPVLLAGTIMLSLAQYIGDLLLARKNTKIIGLSTILAAIVNIIFNIILIPSLGIMGASISTLFSCTIMFVVRFCYAKSLFSCKEVFKLIMLFSIIYIIGSLCIFYAGNKLLLNLFNCLLSCLLFLILNKDVVLGAFNKVFSVCRK